MNKIQYGELAPSTLVSYMERFINFRDFMHEKFEPSSPALISDELIEDEYLAWDNRRGLFGKNWFTDTGAILQTASSDFSDKWPSLSVSKRAVKKIKKTHYSLGKIVSAIEEDGIYNGAEQKAKQIKLEFVE